MFWGLIMEPDRRYTQLVKKSFHISMASMDMNISDKGPAQVMCRYKDRNYLLCTLQNPDLLQCALDLEFQEGTEVSFATNGKAYIHLSGYLTNIDDEEDGLTLEDLEEQEEDELETIESEVSGKRKKTAGKDSSPSKKPKLNGFNHLEDNAEEEESDDEDFEIDEDGEEVSEEESDGAEEESGEEEDGEEEEEEKVEVTTKLSKKGKKKLQQEKEKQKAATPPSPKKQVLKGGVSIQDIKEGTGPKATSGRFINVYYEGRLEKNNKMFDSLTKGPGFKFRLGTGEVIKGWDTGLVGMKVGGVRKIVCPPHAAYGAKGSPPTIPPSSTLVFTVTLKKVN